MSSLEEIKYGVKYFLMNNIVKHIPCWFIRKKCYQLAGMKLGNCHILMNVETDGWRNIVIGDGVCINQYCHLDGKGGLTIGDNASISVYSKILTGTHDKDSESFDPMFRSVVIEPHVWVGINAVILPGSILRKGCILAAGSVAIGKEYSEYKVYSGVPAKYMCDRKSNLTYNLDSWNPFMR